MKFSIIMASYNQVETIQQSIDSLLNQSHHDYELIIIDGNSKDGCIDIINKYQNNSKVKIFIDDNLGLYGARNKGLLEATGDVVGFLNTDDYFELNALEVMNDVFLKDNDLDVAYAINHAVNKDGSFKSVAGDFEYNKEKLIREYIALPDQTTYIRRESLAKVGLYDPTFSIVADWDFWQRCMVLNLKFQRVPVHIANYRQYPDTLTFNPKLAGKRFKEVTRLYKRYNDVFISSFLWRLYVAHYITRHLKKIVWLNNIYQKIRYAK